MFCTVDDTDYHRCSQCMLIFQAPAQRPSQDEEKAQYDLHENDPQDPHYRRFLSRLAVPLLERLPPGASGLDYGCGPGPALVEMMREAGHDCQGYDPIYADHRRLLARRYDFITCTEVVEHFHQPEQEFQQLIALLAPGGWLGVMTSWPPPADQFAGWHYHRDPTHVCFYSPETFQWLASQFGLSLVLPDRNLVLMQKPDTSGQ